RTEVTTYKLADFGNSSPVRADVDGPEGGKTKSDPPQHSAVDGSHPQKYLIESGSGKAYPRPTQVRESMRATAAVGWLSAPVIDATRAQRSSKVYLDRQPKA